MINFNKYLPITPTEMKWGFYLTTTGYSKIAPRTSYPDTSIHPESHYFTWNKGRILDGYYLVFISKGEGVFESSRTQPATVREGTCFFLFPGVWHRYKPDPKSGWEEYWVGFKGSYPDELMSGHFFTPEKPFVNAGHNEELLQLFHLLLSTVKAAGTGYHQIVAGITMQILGLVNAISTLEDFGQDDTSLLINKARFLMRESIEQPRKMTDVAKELPMGYSKFRKAFKSITGMSPTQYYLHIRLKKAKELLSSTTLNIDQVAQQTGFDDLFYFSKLFKKKNGVTPSSFRTGKG